MGCAVVKCIAGTTGEVIQCDVAAMNGRSTSSLTDGRLGSSRRRMSGPSVHVEGGELRHGEREEGDAEDRGAQFVRESRHSFNCEYD